MRVHGEQEIRPGASTRVTAAYARRMELRQLRLFVAVAEELHFGRAAVRSHISGPAMSQQIIALERDIGMELFKRDRRGVALTAAGRTLLEDARTILRLADEARGRLRGIAALSAPLRLGYVSWLPADIRSIDSLRIDEWVLPSHIQADRVAEGTLDAAIAWVTAKDIEQRGLTAHLLFAEALHALVPGAASDQPVPAATVTALTDADQSAWSSWNRFVEEFAASNHARIARIEDGGIAGDAFYTHVRRIGSAVLASPKRHTAPAPPTIRQRPITPAPVWTWSLLIRKDDDRPGLRQVIDSLITLATENGFVQPPRRPWWMPEDDPYHDALTAAG
jgi:DNA-binding transcriptional LysR family regulator